MAFRRGLVLSATVSLIPLAAMAAEPVTTFDAVTTTATRTEQSVSDTPAAVSVVNRADIEREQPQSFGDLLEDIPGVSVTGGARGSAQSVNIRGMSDERVVTRMDGARKTFNAGHKGRFFLDPNLLKQVEVQRGANTVMYGSGALGGVINMRTKDAADFLRDGEWVGALASTGYQSANSHKVASLTGFARPVDALDVVASASIRDNGNTTDGNGDKVPNSSDDITAGMAKGTLTLGDGHSLSLMGMRFRNDQDVPTNADGATVTASNPLVDRKTREDTLVLNWNLAPTDHPLLDLRATLHQTDVQIDERRKPANRFDETSLLTRGVDLANTSRFSVAGLGNTLTYGGDYLHDSQVGKRDGAARDSFPKAEQATMGVFVQDDIQITPMVSVIPGIRYDRVENDRQGQPKRVSEHVSPQATLKVTPSEWLQLWGSYAEAYRAPSLTELYVGGTHYPGNTFIANTSLEPETAHNKELGANLRFADVLRPNDRLRAKVAFFVNDVDNYIDQVIGTTTTQYVNVRNASITGLEAEAGYDMTIAFANLGAAHIKGEDARTGAALSSIPADKVTVVLGGRWIEYDLDFGWRGTFVREQDHVPTGTSTTGGYALHDLFAGWTPSMGVMEGTRLNLAVDNVFDKAYRPHLANTKDPGRNIKLTLSRQF